jgi:hypothetical protein
MLNSDFIKSSKTFTQEDLKDWHTNLDNIIIAKTTTRNNQEQLDLAQYFSKEFLKNEQKVKAVYRKAAPGIVAVIVFMDNTHTEVNGALAVKILGG